MSVRPDRLQGTLVIVAAGRGERFGNGAKVLEIVGGLPVLAWSLAAAEGAASISEIVIVTGVHTRSAIGDLVAQGPWQKPVTLVQGGESRRASVAAGVAVVPDTSEVVLVHDGARPLVTATLIDRCAAGAREHGAAIVAAPVSDTLKRVANGRIEATVARADLWAAQTPQGFRREVLLSAIDRARAMPAAFTDEASMLEALGEPVWIVPGERANIKVTHREDLEIVDALLRARCNRGNDRCEES